MTASQVIEVATPRTGLVLRRWSGSVIALVSVLGLAAIGWPLWIPVPAGVQAHLAVAPFVLAALVPAVLLLGTVLLTDGGLNPRTLAMLGVLSALNAAVRATLGAGTAGFESVFFLLILAGRVFGPGFGFLLGCTSLFASALLTGGVGPWLPFQMLCCAWIGLGAGLLPNRLRGRAELAVLVGYGIVCAYLFGLVMNLWSWPFLTSITGGAAAGGLEYLPGAPLEDNLLRFGWYTLLTSTAGWDTGRAIATTVALLLLGPVVLPVLRRANRSR